MGITDIQNCMKGQISGCVWAAIGALPFGKMFKVAKARPALRKLIGKAGDIRDALKSRKTRVSKALDKATTPAGCVLRGASWSGSVTGSPGTAPAANRADGDDRFTQLGWSHPSYTQVAKCPLRASVKYTPQGRPPVLARYAGLGVKDFDDKHIAKITSRKGDYSALRFKDTGYPDFSPWIIKTPDKKKTPIVLKKFDYQKSAQADQVHADRLAEELFGLPKNFRKDNGATWHHSEIEGVMELVPTDLNGAISHTGGFAMWGAGATPKKQSQNLGMRKQHGLRK